MVIVGATEERALGFAIFHLPAQESFLDSKGDEAGNSIGVESGRDVSTERRSQFVD